jgi:hypothetical protein
MIRRRSFLIGCSGIVAAPVFAHLALPAAAGSDLQGKGDVSLVPTALTSAEGSPDIVLRIDGWDSAADSGDNAWVQINSSWRANWR